MFIFAAIYKSDYYYQLHTIIITSEDNFMCKLHRLINPPTPKAT